MLLRAVAIANDRIQPNPILRSDGDGFPCASPTLAQNRTFRNSYSDSSVRCYPLGLPRSGHPSWHRRADCIEVGGRWCGYHHRGHHIPLTIVIYILAVLCYIVAPKKIPVSIAFPSVPASYALVAVLVHLLWNEPPSLLQITGLALIGSGWCLFISIEQAGYSATLIGEKLADFANDLVYLRIGELGVHR